MELIKVWWANRKAARNLKNLKAAFKIVEKAGFFVCNIQVRGNTQYLVDGRGGFHKIGKRA